MNLISKISVCTKTNLFALKSLLFGEGFRVGLLFSISALLLITASSCKKVKVPDEAVEPELYINLQQSGTTENLRSAHMFNSESGLAVGSIGGMYKTTNGGRTWTKSFPIPQDTSKTLVDTTVVFTRIYFQNATTGWLLGTLNARAATGTQVAARRTVLRKTVDGGATWVNKDFDNTVKTFTRIAFVDDYIGFVIGNGGLIFRTDDGGFSWTKQTSGVTSNLTGLTVVDANTAYICGTNGVFLKTTDGGNNWISQTTPSKRAFKSMAFVSPTLGFMTGGGPNNGGPNDDKAFVYKTDSYGSFTDITSYSYAVFYYNDIEVVGDKNIWTAGHLGQIFNSTDGGVTWSEELSKSNRQEHLQDIVFPTSRIGYFFGDGGVILKVDLDKK